MVFTRFYLFVAFLCVWSCGQLAFAATWDQQDLISEKENSIHERIRMRAYPGGKDEEPLRVQEQLPTANRKLQPAQEPVEDDTDTANE